MSKKASANRRKRNKNALRPNSKAFWAQRIMGMFLLFLILGILLLIGVNFFKEHKESYVRPVAEKPSVQTEQQNNRQAVQAAQTPKYSFYESLRKRDEQVKTELQHKIAQADKSSIKGRHYRIQLGAFSEEAHADRLRAKMILRDYPVQIIKDGTLFLVQIGPYAEREEAVNIQNRLQREGIKDHVLKAYVN